MAAKKKPGRPKKPQSQRRDIVVRVRVTPGEHERITKAAQADDVSVSAWARRKLLDEL